MSEENKAPAPAAAPTTTAEMLGSFRKELVDQGFNENLAEALALDWGRAIAHTGGALSVKVGAAR